MESRRRTAAKPDTQATILDDPQHPALQGRYHGAGKVERVNFFREERKVWEAVEIYLTLRCPLACRHCITNSHPGRRETMSADLLDALIDGFGELPDTRYLCLFGGEPLLEPALLHRAIERTRHRGMVPSVVTSGIWGRSPEETSEALAVLEGADRLLVSADRHHAPFLDPAATISAAVAARRRGLKTTICYTAEPDEFFGTTELPAPLLEACVAEDIGIVVTPLSDAGRAAGRQAMIPEIAPITPCGKVDVPLVDTTGNVFACGPGWTIPREGESKYLLGRFPEESLGALRQRRIASPLFQLINQEGVLAALERMAATNPTWERDLAANPPRTPCGACQQLSRWLADDSVPHWRRDLLVQPMSATTVARES